MEDNSMDNNDQLKAVLIKKLEEIKINDQEDSKSIMWKLPEIAAVALVFIAIVTITNFDIKDLYIKYHTEHCSIITNDFSFAIYLAYSIPCFIGIACFLAAVKLYTLPYLKEIEAKQQKANIMNAREKYLIQAILDIEYQQNKNQKSKQEVIRTIDACQMKKKIFGIPIFAHRMTEIKGQRKD